MKVSYRSGNFRVYKISGVYVIIDNRGKNWGHFGTLGMAMLEIVNLTHIA